MPVRGVRGRLRVLAPTYAWEGLDPALAVIAPSIDAFSPKNQAMLVHRASTAILRAAGLAADRRPLARGVRARSTAAPARVDAPRAMIEERRCRSTRRWSLQVSRWDRAQGPARRARRASPSTSRRRRTPHLVLPARTSTAVADDPEGAEVLAEVGQPGDDLPREARRRVHLALLPMDDPDENATIVNALQRRADIVVQKSLAEGFGLTVAEAMWKGRPVVASARRRHPGPDRGRRDRPAGRPARPRRLRRAVRDLLADPHAAERSARRRSDASASSSSARASRPVRRPAFRVCVLLFSQALDLGPLRL